MSLFSAPSLAVYGTTAGIALLFFTNDWVGRDLLEYVPWYNKRYEGVGERMRGS